MLRQIILFAMLLTPSAATAAVCEDIGRLIALAPSDFREIRGARDPETDGWYATRFKLANAECIIDDDGDGDGATYDCTWTYGDEASARAAYSKLAPTISACLNGKKSKPLVPRQVTLSTAVLMGLTYAILDSEDDDIDAKVELKRYESRRQTLFDLTFSVRRTSWK